VTGVERVADTQLVRAEHDRATPAPEAPVDSLVAGLHDFTVAMAAQSPPAQNLVFSPVSIAAAFAMVQAGAAPETAAQIGRAFGFPDQPGVHEAMNALTASLLAASRGDGDEPLVLDLLHTVWGQRGAELGPAFLDALARHYGAGVVTTDFAGDADGSRAAINAAVSDATRGRIPELVPDGTITPDTLVVLVNAIYLRARWATPFPEDATTDRPFHLTDGSSVDVPTMADRLTTAASRGDGYRAVTLPYVGYELAMTVVVPDEGTPLADFERGLDGARLRQIADGLDRAIVDLRLPRWDLDACIDLRAPLTALGLPIPGGDLSPMVSGPPLRGEPPGIGAAVHAANITVDEHETEAAAATAVVAAARGLPQAPPPLLEITVDRPFLFLVRHVVTGAPLFYGRVTNPLF
jgi:serine protease inhibitor